MRLVHICAMHSHCVLPKKRVRFLGIAVRLRCEFRPIIFYGYAIWFADVIISLQDFPHSAQYTSPLPLPSPRSPNSQLKRRWSAEQLSYLSAEIRELKFAPHKYESGLKVFYLFIFFSEFALHNFLRGPCFPAQDAQGFWTAVVVRAAAAFQ